MDYIKCNITLETIDKQIYYTDKFGCLVPLDAPGKDRFFENLKDLRTRHIVYNTWLNNSLKMHIEFEMTTDSQIQIDNLNYKFGNSNKVYPILADEPSFSQFLKKVVKYIDFAAVKIPGHNLDDSNGL